MYESIRLASKAVIFDNLQAAMRSSKNSGTGSEKAGKLGEGSTYKYFSGSGRVDTTTTVFLRIRSHSLSPLKQKQLKDHARKLLSEHCHSHSHPVISSCADFSKKENSIRVL